MDRQGRNQFIGRETAGFLLLLVLLVLGIYTSLEMSRTHNAISRELEDAAWYALSGDWESARMATASAESKWREHWNLSTLLADHSPMEQIDAMFASVDLYSAAKEAAEFAAGCGELSRYVRAMGEAHRFSWQNIL